MCEEVVEVQIRPKNASLGMLYHEGHHMWSPMADQLIVYRAVVPETREEFAIDLTAPVCGWREVLSPWDVFAKHRIRLAKRGALGGALEMELDRKLRAGTLDPEDDLEAGVRRAHMALVSTLLRPIEQWMAQTQTTVPQLFDLPESEYRTQQDTLYAMAEEALVDFVDAQYSTKRFCLYYNRTGRTQLTVRPTSAEFFQHVWSALQDGAERARATWTRYSSCTGRS